MTGKDISNRFLSIEIIIPFLLLAVGGLISYGSLSSDVEHKAEAADVQVLQNEVKHIKETVEKNAEQLDKNADKLDAILRKVDKP